MKTTKFITCQFRYLASNVGLNERQAQLMSRGLPTRKPITGVKQLLLVSSAKGGVGKSTVSVNLACAMKYNEPNKEFGLLDADIFGPSIPLMMNLHEEPILTKDWPSRTRLCHIDTEITEDGGCFLHLTLKNLEVGQDNLIVPLTNYGVKCMSMGFLVEKESAVIWRGMMVMKALEKLMRHVQWGSVDCLIVDTPPGTGDTLLSLIQNLPISGTVLVTTPQTAALQVLQRGITMLRKLDVPIAGIVENMGSAKCPTCNTSFQIFGEGTASLAQELSIDLMQSIPLNSNITECGDEGKPIVFADPKSIEADAFLNLAKKVSSFLKQSC